MTLSAQAPLGSLGTLYGRTGDAFGWACVGTHGVPHVLASKENRR
jgi:hypothetical protein